MTQPRMFIWQSRMLANYGPGHIIVVAQNIEDARRLARLEVENYARQRVEDFFIEEGEREDICRLGLEDLEVEPEQRMSFLIRGSD